MIVMVSNATGIEVGLLAGRYPGRIGHLFSPGGQRGPWRELPYALDNGAWPALPHRARGGVLVGKITVTGTSLDDGLLPSYKQGVNMKIRDLEPGDPTTWRQALGVAIHAQRVARERTLPEVARRCKVSQGTVENWERGFEVPTADEWKALCQGINRSLNLYTETWRKARAEARAQRDTITRSIEVHTNGSNSKPLTANLGDKIAAVVPPKPGALLPPIVSVQTAAPAPDARTVNPGQAVAYVQPAPKPPQTGSRNYTARDMLGIPDDGQRTANGKRLPPPAPAGSRSRAMIEKKSAFVRDLILARPNISTYGGDSVLEALRLRFGAGLSPDTIESIREELGRSRFKPSGYDTAVAAAVKGAAIIEATPAPELWPAHDPSKPAPVITGLVATEPTNDNDNIRSAVELIRDAIPNLMTFTVDVDEHGEATVNYQVRKVEITTHAGSFKVGRK